MVQYLHGSCKATSAVIVSVLRPVSTEAQQTRTLSARHLPIALKRRVELLFLLRIIITTKMANRVSYAELEHYMVYSSE